MYVTVRSEQSEEQCEEQSEEQCVTDILELRPLFLFSLCFVFIFQEITFQLSLLV